MKNDVQPRRFSTYGELFFSRDSVFNCLLLPENVIICNKCLSKCGKWEKLNNLRFYYILRLYYILRPTVEYDLELFSITKFY